MTHRFYHQNEIRNATVARPVSPRVFAWLAVIAIAGALISCGFVISARQHFNAIELGYQSEALRREEAELQEKRRQLSLELERASSPVAVEKRARKMGLGRPPIPEPEAQSSPPADKRSKKSDGR